MLESVLESRRNRKSQKRKSWRKKKRVWNELEKEKEGRQRKGMGYKCGGDKKKKKKRMDDRWCERKNNIKNKKW